MLYLLTTNTALPDDVPHKRVIELINKIKSALKHGCKFGDKVNSARVAEWEAQLEEMKLIASKTAPPHAADSKLPAPLRKALKALAEEAVVIVVLGELAEAEESMLVGDSDDEDDCGASPYDTVDWATGVEFFQNHTPADMWRYLGMPDGVIPGFNLLQDPNGILDPTQEKEWSALVQSGGVTELAPFWHQIVGIAQLTHNALKGQPTLLMDEVGVGKTMQVVGFIATYPQYFDFHNRHGKFPGNFSKRFVRV